VGGDALASSLLSINSASSATSSVRIPGLGVGTYYEHWDPYTEAGPRRRDMIIKAATIVIRQEDRRGRPLGPIHQLGDQGADPVVTQSHRKAIVLRVYPLWNHDRKVGKRPVLCIREKRGI
jgi:hypothetical protein